MEMADEMELLFQEVENDTILPAGTLSSFYDPTWSDLSPISSSVFLSPDETRWSLDVEDLMKGKGDLLTDAIQSFPEEINNESEIGFDSHEFDVLLQQSPPSSDDHLSTVLDDSYVTSFLETLSPQMVSQGSPLSNTFMNPTESLSMNNSSDDLGSLVELLQKPTGVCTFDWLPNAADEFISGGLSRSSGISDVSLWDYTTSTSGCTSDHSVGSTKIMSSNMPGGGLNCQFSSATKRRRLESSLPASNMMKPSGFNASDRNLNSVLKRDSLDGNVNLQTSRDIVANIKEGSLIGDRCSMNVRNGNKPEIGCGKPSKTIKKKTKPGSRSVPKDRMLTYACYAELRELIPNGEKLSIDRLLHRTIKQLLFLQSVAKHAKGLAKHQLLKDRKDQKDHFKNVASGVTRACEIENETLICPLVVEDLSAPGQMLIKILCQEQGFFLEIVDMIRGFGLNILKGSMEVHEANKIHAHYIVEAEENRFVSRHEIFSSLVHILRLTDADNDFSGDDKHGNVRQGGVGLLNNSLQYTCCAPASLPNRMPCITIL